jgi:hypothetical protein
MKPLLPVLALGLGFTAVSAHAVDLMFRWKPGMECRMEHYRKGDDRAGTMRSVLVTSATRTGGILISFKQNEFSPEGETSQPLSPLMALDLAGMVPASFEVDAHGRFMGIRNIESTRQSMQEVLDSSSMRADAKLNSLEMLTLNSTLEIAARRLWTSAVQTWTGTHPKQGERVEVEGPSSLPFPNVSYAARHTTELRGTQPCAPTRAEACVLLTSSQIPDRDSIQGSVVAMVTPRGVDREKNRIDGVDVRVDTETLTRPDTLVPVRVHYQEFTQITKTVNGITSQRTSSKKHEWKFDCD